MMHGHGIAVKEDERIVLSEILRVMKEVDSIIQSMMAEIKDGKYNDAQESLMALFAHVDAMRYFSDKCLGLFTGYLGHREQWEFYYHIHSGLHYITMLMCEEKFDLYRQYLEILTELDDLGGEPEKHLSEILSSLGMIEEESEKIIGLIEKSI